MYSFALEDGGTTGADFNGLPNKSRDRPEAASRPAAVAAGDATER
jgi:hypothetical protein